MQDLQIFNSAEFGEIRTLQINGEPWFIGKDVALALGYSNPRDAIARHVDDEDKGVVKRDTLNGGMQLMTVINESGLYALVFGSRLVAARKFKHWVTSEILPSIRKSGGYQLPRTYTEALEQLLEKAKENDRLKLENKEMQPKALFADAVASSDSDILVGELAKIICQNGCDIGQNRLFTWLRDNGYLIKSGADRNMPMQRYVEQGLFRIKERTVSNPDGSVRITKTTLVTGKGQLYFINKFLGKTA